jgi:hypothetical protein
MHLRVYVGHEGCPYNPLWAEGKIYGKNRSDTHRGVVAVPVASQPMSVRFSDTGGIDSHSEIEIIVRYGIRLTAKPEPTLDFFAAWVLSYSPEGVPSALTSLFKAKHTHPS